jgi:hypothetical protein
MENGLHWLEMSRNHVCMMNGNMNLQPPYQLFQMDRMSNADPVHVPNLPSQLCGQFEWRYQVLSEDQLCEDTYGVFILMWSLQFPEMTRHQ